MNKKTLMAIIGVATAIALTSFLPLREPSKERAFNRYKKAIRECYKAEEFFINCRSPKNEKILENKKRILEKIDKKFEPIDYFPCENQREYFKRMRAFSKQGYFFRKFYDSAFLVFDEEFYPMELGKIVERGEFSCNDWGKPKKINYLVYERDIGERGGWVEDNTLCKKVYGNGEIFIPIEKKNTKNMAWNIYATWKLGKDKEFKDLSPISKLHRKVCEQIVKENGTDDLELFREKYWEKDKYSTLHHEANHLDNTKRKTSEIESHLTSIVYTNPYITFECLESMQGCNSDLLKRNVEATNFIFKEFEKRGYTKDKLYSAPISEIQKIAKEIYRNCTRIY